jgi:hypothetical protein
VSLLSAATTLAVSLEFTAAYGDKIWSNMNLLASFKVRGVAQKIAILFVQKFYARHGKLFIEHSTDFPLLLET